MIFKQIKHLFCGKKLSFHHMFIICPINFTVGLGRLSSLPRKLQPKHIFLIHEHVCVWWHKQENQNAGTLKAFRLKIQIKRFTVTDTPKPVNTFLITWPFLFKLPESLPYICFCSVILWLQDMVHMLTQCRFNRYIQGNIYVSMVELKAVTVKSLPQKESVLYSLCTVHKLETISKLTQLELSLYIFWCNHFIQ